MIIPYPACFYQPDPVPCLAIYSCSNCCTDTDIMLGLLATFLNLLLFPFFAAVLVLVSLVLSKLIVAAEVKWKMKRLQEDGKE